MNDNLMNAITEHIIWKFATYNDIHKGSNLSLQKKAYCFNLLSSAETYPYKLMMVFSDGFQGDFQQLLYA